MNCVGVNVQTVANNSSMTRTAESNGIYCTLNTEAKSQSRIVLGFTLGAIKTEIINLSVEDAKTLICCIAEALGEKV